MNEILECEFELRAYNEAYEIKFKCPFITDFYSDDLT